MRYLLPRCSIGKLPLSGGDLRHDLRKILRPADTTQLGAVVRGSAQLCRRPGATSSAASPARSWVVELVRSERVSEARIDRFVPAVAGEVPARALRPAVARRRPCGGHHRPSRLRRRGRGHPTRSDRAAHRRRVGLGGAATGSPARGRPVRGGYPPTSDMCCSW